MSFDERLIKTLDNLKAAPKHRSAGAIIDAREQIKQAFADEVDAAELRVIQNHKWPYEHAVAITELKTELGICLHEDYAYNGGKCSQCGKVFPGVYI